MAIFSRYSDLDNPEYQSDTGGLTPIALALLNSPFYPNSCSILPTLPILPISRENNLTKIALDPISKKHDNTLSLGSAGRSPTPNGKETHP